MLSLLTATAVLAASALVLSGPGRASSRPHLKSSLNHAGGPDLAASEIWYGIHFNGDRIGYAGVNTRPVLIGGKKVMRSDSQMLTRLKLLGVEVTEEMAQSDLFRPDGTPISTEFDNRSNGHHSHLLATFTPSAIHCTIGDGQTTSHKLVPIPAGVHLTYDDSYTLPQDHLKPGIVWTDTYFDPATLAIETLTGKVGQLEDVQVGVTTRKAWRVDARSVMGDAAMEVAPDGTVLTMTMPLGIQLVEEPRAVARAAEDYHPSADLAMAGSVDAHGPEIENPREADSLALQLTGVPAGREIPSGPGQEAIQTGAGAWKVRIWRTPFPSAPARVPLTAPAEALKATAELNSDTAAMVQKARSIVGGETDGRKAVTLLHDWVNRNMRARYDIAVLRSGMDVLQDREGVCRDYAVLYASLARAAGIPTRVCAGVVYWKGRFYYHAWDESFIGDWVRVDSTMPDEMADATHLTLARGDARDMYRITALIGTFQIWITDTHA